MNTYPLKGYLFLSGSILTWGLFPIASSILLQNIPIIFLAGVSTCIAGVFCGIFLAFQKKLNVYKNKGFKDMLIATLLITICFYILFFWGIKNTTANNAALIGQIETLFVLIIFGLF